MADEPVNIYAYTGSDTVERLTCQIQNEAGTTVDLIWTNYAKISLTVRRASENVGTLLKSVNSVTDPALFAFENSGKTLVLNVSALDLPPLNGPRTLSEADREYYETVLKVHDTVTSRGEVVADLRADNSRPTLLLRVYSATESGDA